MNNNEVRISSLSNRV